MTLVEHYRLDVAGLSFKEAQKRRLWWHHMAKRYLVMLAMTSDRVDDFPTDRDDDGQELGQVQPWPHFWAKWLDQPVELAKLYRATKKVKK